MNNEPQRQADASPFENGQESSASRRWYLRPLVALVAAMAWFAAAVLSQGVLKLAYGDLDDFPQVQKISLLLMVILLLASIASIFAAPVLLILGCRYFSSGDDPGP